jgi:hypothetical protein
MRKTLARITLALAVCAGAAVGLLISPAPAAACGTNDCRTPPPDCTGSDCGKVRQAPVLLSCGDQDGGGCALPPDRPQCGDENGGCVWAPMPTWENGQAAKAARLIACSTNDCRTPPPDCTASDCRKAVPAPELLSCGDQNGGGCAFPSSPQCGNENGGCAAVPSEPRVACATDGCSTPPPPDCTGSECGKLARTECGTNDCYAPAPRAQLARSPVTDRRLYWGVAA